MMMEGCAGALAWLLTVIAVRCNFMRQRTGLPSHTVVALTLAALAALLAILLLLIGDLFSLTVGLLSWVTYLVDLHFSSYKKPLRAYTKWDCEEVSMVCDVVCYEGEHTRCGEKPIQSGADDMSNGGKQGESYCVSALKQTEMSRYTMLRYCAGGSRTVFCKHEGLNNSPAATGWGRPRLWQTVSAKYGVI
jgi:hypothetical protein